MDIANALCKEMEARCKIVAQDWDGIILHYLLVNMMQLLPQCLLQKSVKRRLISLKNMHLFQINLSLKKGTKLVMTKEGLKGVTVGVQRATTHDKYLTDNFGKGVDLKRYGSFDEAYLDLKAGRIDTVLGDASALEEGLLNKPGGTEYEFVGPSLTDPKWFGEGFGIATRKQDKDLTEQLNAAIDSLREKGIYQEIAAKYFNYDVYGE